MSAPTSLPSSPLPSLPLSPDLCDPGHRAPDLCAAGLRTPGQNAFHQHAPGQNEYRQHAARQHATQEPGPSAGPATALPAPAGAGAAGHGVTQALRRMALLGAVAGLAACKGGGGVSLPAVPAPQPGGSGVLSSYYVESFAPYAALARQLRTSVARYTVQSTGWTNPDTGLSHSSYPLAAARVDYAHAVGLTGAGQTVAVVDNGFLRTHETLAGKTLTVSGSPGVADHGTGVASIIAGDSDTMIGVAPGADLLIAGFDDRGEMATATRAALAAGAVAQNNSWAYTTLAADANGFADIFSDTDGRAYLSALTDYAAQGVVVFALTNNSAQTQSRLMEGLPILQPGLEPGWLAVGNAAPVFNDNRVTGATMISSDCLQAARWCMVADGTWTLASADSTGSYGFGTGASFAAPQVAGALALLAQAFPDLTPQDLRIRLLASADNSFFTPTGTVELATGFSHGFNNVYGHGFLDLRAALLPIGTPSVTTTGGEVIALDAPMVRTGRGMGDALAASLAGQTVAVADSLSARFAMPAPALVAVATPAPRAETLLARSLAADLGAERQAAPTALPASFAAHDGPELSLPSAEDAGLRAQVLLPGANGGGGVALLRGFEAGATRFDLGLKVAQDAGGVVGFGSRRDGGPGSDMVALQMGLSQDLAGGGFLAMGAEMGLADMGTPGGLTDVSLARFDSLSVEFGQRDAFARGDRLSLGLSMPLAVAQGSARLDVPLAMPASAAGQPQTTAARTTGAALDLAPQDRQIDLALTYQAPLGDGQELKMQLLHAQNYGNVAGRTDTAAVVAYTFRF